MGNGRDGEDAARQLFQERYGLQLRKIKEAKSLTPDFEVLASGRRVAVLEVKTAEYTGLEMVIDKDDDIEDRLRELAVTEADLRDRTGSRVGAKIHAAGKQLAMYPNDPKILVLVNKDSCADRSDLREALEGYLVDPADGARYTTLQPVVEERLRVDRTRIDIYIWIDLFGTPEVKAVRWTTDVGHRLCDDHFKATTVERAP